MAPITLFQFRCIDSTSESAITFLGESKFTFAQCLLEKPLSILYLSIQVTL